jgi:hypothetical protein
LADGRGNGSRESGRATGRRNAPVQGRDGGSSNPRRGNKVKGGASAEVRKEHRKPRFSAKQIAEYRADETTMAELIVKAFRRGTELATVQAFTVGRICALAVEHFESYAKAAEALKADPDTLEQLAEQFWAAEARAEELMAEMVTIQ